MRLSTTVIVLLLAAAALWADESDAPQPATPPEAVAAVKRYDTAIAAADAVQQKAANRAKDNFLADLKVAKRVAMDKGDLDGAVAIEKMEKNGAPPKPASVSFDGDWDVFFSAAMFSASTSHRVYHIKDGKLWVNDARKVEFRVIDGTGYATWGQEVYRFSLASDRLVVELFVGPSGHKVGDKPDQMGLGSHVQQ